MNPDGLQTKIDDTITGFNNELQTQEVYTSLTTSNHSHNGMDAPKIDFSSLNNANSYIVLKSVTLTSAQLLAMFTTPITIVPAMGLNTGIIIEGITGFIRYNTATYAGANNIEIRYTNGSGAKVTADIPVAFLNATVDTPVYVPPVTTAITPVINSPIVAFIPTANPTTGNSVINLTIKYRVVNYK